jgi:RNA polymerase sigma-70 factor (ECF subfamily)
VLIYLQLIEDESGRNKFLQLYYTYRSMMFHTAIKLLNNEQDAEDAVHQAFLAIIENLDKIKGVHSERTRAYIAIITERKAIDIIRVRAKFVDVNVEDTIGGMDITYEGDSDLARAMARLPARYREMLLLRYDSGYSTREIAQMLGMKRGTGQKVIWRAKEALQRELEKEGRHE